MKAFKKNIRKIDRLKKRSDFLWAQQNGRKWIAKGLIVEIVENDARIQTPMLRFGLTVSKRVSKLAVARNRLKRRLRTICLETLPDYAGHSLDIVVIGRFAAIARDNEILQKDLMWCLEKMGVEKLPADAKQSTS